MTFPGFPARAQSTAIPNVFFSDLLPQLTEAGALAVAVCAIHALSKKRGFPRYTTAAELAAEPALVVHLSALGDAEALLAAGLRRTVECGALLALDVRGAETTSFYFLNTPADRRGLESVRAGDVRIPAAARMAAGAAQRSSIYSLYESLIGTVGPGITEELTAAEQLYPPEWLEAAFREAAAQNARSWRYITRILERWAREGRDHAQAHGDSADGDRYFAGKYGRILRQRLGR